MDMVMLYVLNLRIEFSKKAFMETTSSKYPETRNYIGGKFAALKTRTRDVITPLSGEVLSKVALSDAEDLDRAVIAARKHSPHGPLHPLKKECRFSIVTKH